GSMETTTADTAVRSPCWFHGARLIGMKEPSTRSLSSSNNKIEGRRGHRHPLIRLRQVRMKEKKEKAMKASTEANHIAPEQPAYSVRKWLLALLGTLCLLAGIIGIFVPIWPTTCFLLMAAACYSKSSEKMHRWLMENRWFGRHLKRYQQSGTVDPRIKNLSVASLWISALI